LYLLPNFKMTLQTKGTSNQCVGSGLDPDTTDSESGTASRRAKITHKERKSLEISCFDVLDVLF
jgi:hypothetical protein